MPDVILHVDNLLAERIKSLTRDRQWSISEVLLHALRKGLGFPTEQGSSETLFDSETLTVLGGDWEVEERGAFQEALNALAHAPATQFAPENIRVDVSAMGAE